MADFRDDLERERRRFAMPGDAFDRLKGRRARRQRDRRIAAVVVGLVVAGSGVGGGVYALRSSGAGPQPEPISSPTPSPIVSSPTIEPTPSAPPTSPSPSPSGPPPEGLAPAISGPIQFMDELVGWMVDEQGRVQATTDGGKSWNPIYSDSPEATAVDFVNAHDGWIVTDGGLLRSRDGGSTWEDLQAGGFSSVQFLSQDKGWGVALLEGGPNGLGRLVTTPDGGATWVPPDRALDVNSVCFVDEMLGWAAGPSEGGVSLFRTGDGGVNWTETGIGLEGGDQVGYTGTVRCGGIDAWVLAVGGAGAGHVGYAVFRTAEGGPSVDPVLQEPYTHPVGTDQGIPESTNPYPGPLAAFDGLRADLVTWCPVCGGDLPFVSLEWTDDGGASWAHPTIVGSDQPSEPLGISFLDQERGWILLRDMQTQEGVVLRTTDGGQTWQTP